MNKNMNKKPKKPKLKNKKTLNINTYKNNIFNDN